MVFPKLLPSEVVVFNVAMGDLETEAAVVGNLARPTQGVPGEVVTLIQEEVATPTQGEVATPIQGTRVLLMFPPVGMEVLIVVVLVRAFTRFCRTCNVPFPSWIRHCTYCQAIVS